MSFATTDTIVAVATPPGRGGIGIVRLSGPEARGIAQTLLTHDGPLQPRHATFTKARLQAPCYGAQGGPEALDGPDITDASNLPRGSQQPDTGERADVPRGRLTSDP